ncbi:bifunctional 2',3'-cyclic-nucleotide 2'-phosphodiesterase/3'-nucleotidase [Pseudoduganella eburnea]|uniref:Bifunctional 2',3'-cyclic-nucleotide 2'-phosphodiesterase/3'-nucleotidase n=1 Tax=Massilia eburnea TaxID=1776165 RepID=A0A6L6QNM4_9BURK|nr:bifunctional 2',3'-cyclic-nucleotide 2'-phosphodiesterase/3'-nucleotidase [Massilia eburnea]MTW14028.1 bifunctional 2',3'-cyclic-nucleotide 2'-phosphodiesterase/3'-nucleotidase [Massilia eburnea]
MRFSYLVPAAAILAACGSIPSKLPQGARASLAIIETTDLHANVLSYDYYKLAPDASLGLERTATLIRQARKDFPDSLLLDNGDTIQGTALGDYQALVAPVGCGQPLAIYKAMNALGYDGGSVGNHDFNWGLEFLGQVTATSPQHCAGPAFPIVLANVVDAHSGKPLFAPYRIIDTHVTATGPDGKAVAATVKVGIIGFTTPAIMGWDKRWLEGRVRTEGWRETAQRYIPEMRAKGAEVIVAISHGGLDGAQYAPSMENGSWHLAQVPGIDALLLGHSHEVFPNAASKSAGFNLPDVDKARGTVHGVPTVMAGLWGKQIGVIQLALHHDGKRWVADSGAAQVETRSIQRADRSFVEPDPEIAALVKSEHEATIAYVKTPIGDTDFRMSAYFADVGDVSAIQVVNQAQAEYVRRYVQANLPQYAQLPVLSVSAPFKTGAAGVADYTDVAPGNMALNNAADLYLYPNDLHAVKVNGAILKAWLERAAGRFNTIDPARSEPQELVNTAFPGFNFDMLSDPDVRYQVDVTQAPGQRVKGLSWRGQPVRAEQEFIVATNNYRASGGGGFPGLDGSKTVFASPDNNRAVLIAYIKSVRHLNRAANGSAHSWRFARVRTKGPVIFHSAPGKLALAKDAGLAGISVVKDDDGSGKGYSLYAIDLNEASASPAGRE